MTSLSWGAEQAEKSAANAPVSPTLAQVELPEISRQLEVLLAETAAREQVVARLKAESDKLKSATMPERMKDDIEKLASRIEAQPKAKEGYTIVRGQFSGLQFLFSKVTDDMWDTFPGILDLWRNSRASLRSSSTPDEQYLLEVTDRLQNAPWRTEPMRLLDDVRRMVDSTDLNTQSVVLPLRAPADLRSNFTPANFASVIREMQDAVTSELNSQDAKLSTIRAKTGSLRERQQQLQQAVEEGQSQIDKRIMQWGLPAFGLLLLGILVIPRLYKNPELQTIIFSSGIVLDMFTVFLLTITILLLGLGHRLSEDVLGTLLGGISGYVLGRSNTRIPSNPAH